jgi:DNA primase large subunit
MSVEKITALYSNLPDFDERITTYQLEHIKKRSYTMPGCSTLLTYGLCCADCRIGSPLNWKGKIWGSGKVLPKKEVAVVNEATDEGGGATDG